MEGAILTYLKVITLYWSGDKTTIIISAYPIFGLVLETVISKIRNRSSNRSKKVLSPLRLDFLWSRITNWSLLCLACFIFLTKQDRSTSSSCYFCVSENLLFRSS
jgi:hypothetical protein